MNLVDTVHEHQVSGSGSGGGSKPQRSLRRRTVESESVFRYLGQHRPRETKVLQQIDNRRGLTEKNPLQLWEELHCRKSGSAITEDDDNNNNKKNDINRRYGSSWEPFLIVPPSPMPVSDREHNHCAEEGATFRFQNLLYHPHRLYNDESDSDVDGESASTIPTPPMTDPLDVQYRVDVICCDAPLPQHLDIGSTSDSKLERNHHLTTMTTNTRNSDSSSRYWSPTPSFTITGSDVFRRNLETGSDNDKGISCDSEIKTVAGLPPGHRKTAVSIQIALSSVACVLMLLLVLGIALPLVRKKQRSRTSTYNLYLLYLSIPDLVYNTFLVYLFIKFPCWVDDTNTTTKETKTRYHFPELEFPWDLALLQGCITTSLYTSAVITYEILKLLRSSKNRKRCKAPRMKRATIQAACTYTLGLIAYIVDHYVGDIMNDKSDMKRTQIVSLAVVLTMGLPISYMLWACFRIYWEGLFYNPFTPAGKRLGVLVRYFSRIIIVYIIIWVPITAVYISKFASKNPGLHFYLVCVLYALQTCVSFGLSLSKPDIRKNVKNLLLLHPFGGDIGDSVMFSLFFFKAGGTSEGSRSTPFRKMFTTSTSPEPDSGTTNAPSTNPDSSEEQTPGIASDFVDNDEKHEDGKDKSPAAAAAPPPPPPDSAAIDEEEDDENMFDFEVVSSHPDERSYRRMLISKKPSNPGERSKPGIFTSVANLASSLTKSRSRHAPTASNSASSNGASSNRASSNEFFSNEFSSNGFSSNGDSLNRSSSNKLPQSDLLKSITESDPS